MIHWAVLLRVRRGVGGDDRTAGVQGGEQLGQGRDLVGLVRHSALSHDHAARPARGRQEVGGRVGAGAGPAHGLAVHGDHPAAGDGAGAGEEPGGQAGVEARGVQVLQDPPDRGLTGQGPPLLQAQGPQVGGGQVGGVLPYRRQAAASRQYPRHGQAQDRDQGWRTPRRSRGSVTPFRTSFRGWRDRAVVVDDGMAARPPRRRG